MNALETYQSSNRPSHQHPQQRLLDIIVAFGHMAGKSMKLLEAADTLDDQHLNEAEDMLRHIRRWCEKQDAKEFPDLAKLAQQIDSCLKT